MPNIICSDCGNVSKTDYKFCIVCGSDLKGESKPVTQTPVIREETFFCPKCRHANPIDEIICSNCREDFGKYDIRKSFSESSKSRSGVYKDVAGTVVQPSRSSDVRLVMYILAFFVAIGVGIFLWWIFNVWGGY